MPAGELDQHERRAENGKDQAGNGPGRGDSGGQFAEPAFEFCDVFALLTLNVGLPALLRLDPPRSSVIRASTVSSRRRMPRASSRWSVPVEGLRAGDAMAR